MWIDIQQNSDEWLAARSGKVTGSAISKIMANYGKAFGEPARKLAVDIAVGRITGSSILNGYTNAHMQRGHEQEPLARVMYESAYFTDVTNGGFFDNGKTGCSTDGMVGDDGIIEIKSVIPSVQYERVRKGEYDKSHHWQLLFNLRETGRRWIDYVSFCADFPEDKRLMVFRLCAENHAEDFNKIALRLAEFETLVDTVTKDIKS